MKVETRNSQGTPFVLDLDEIAEFAHQKKKIALIKEYRHLTGKGLRESKEAVEAMMENSVESVVNGFKGILGLVFEPFTKEEFMFLIEGFIDNMEAYHFDDMLIATMTGLENVKRRGGLDHLAKQRQQFLDQI